jgi:hypothetical protein
MSGIETKIKSFFLLKAIALKIQNADMNGINNDSMGKFKIHPFGQEKAILNENGLILRKRLYPETRPFHQKPSIHQKGLIYNF